MLIVIHGFPAFQALVAQPEQEPKHKVLGQALTAVEERPNSAYTPWGLQ